MENIEFTKLMLAPNNISCRMCFKIKNDKNNNTEQIHICNSSIEDVIYSFEENRVGTSLMSFLNNYDKIIDEFEKYINKYENIVDFSFENLYMYMKELESNLLKIFDEVRIISITLNQFLCDMRYDFEKETYNFNLENYHEGLVNNDRYDFKDMAIHYSSIRNYRNYEDSNIFYKKLWIRFLKHYKNSLEELKNKLDNAFMSKENKSNYAKKFTGITTILPIIEVFYPEETYSNYIEPIEYRYDIKNFSNFVYSSLHSIFLTQKTIAKCKYNECNKYFVTCEENDEIYCPNLDGNGYYKTTEEQTIKDLVHNYRNVVDSNCRRKAREENANRTLPSKQSKFSDERIMKIKGQIMDRLSRTKKDGQLIYGDLKQKFTNEFGEELGILNNKYPNNPKQVEKEMLDYVMKKNTEYRKK